MENVGTDFDLRMQGDPEPSKIVPLPVKGNVPAPQISEGTEWALARALLHTEGQGPHRSWFQALVRAERAGGRLTLRALSRFRAAYVQTPLSRRLLAPVQSVDADVAEISLIL